MAKHSVGAIVVIHDLHAAVLNNSFTEDDENDNLLNIDDVVRLRKIQIRAGIASERTVTAAYLVSDGIDMSCVGYVADRYQKHFDLLDGRIAQVVRFLDDSDEANLRAYSDNNGGAYDAVLIDRVVQGDEELNKLLAYD